MKLLPIAFLLLSLVGCNEGDGNDPLLVCAHNSGACCSGVVGDKCSPVAPPSWYIRRVDASLPAKVSLSVDGQEIFNQCTPLSNGVHLNRVTSSNNHSFWVPVALKPTTVTALVEIVDCDHNLSHYSNPAVQIKQFTPTKQYFYSDLN